MSNLIGNQNNNIALFTSWLFSARMKNVATKRAMHFFLFGGHFSHLSNYYNGFFSINGARNFDQKKSAEPVFDAKKKRDFKREKNRESKEFGHKKIWRTLDAVSYTHLTLPTKRIV